MRTVIAIFAAGLFAAPVSAQMTSNCMAMGGGMVNCQNSDGSNTSCMAMGPTMSSCNTMGGGGPASGGYGEGGPTLGDVVQAWRESRAASARSKTAKALAAGDCATALTAIAKAGDPRLAMEVRDYCAVHVGPAPVVTAAPTPAPSRPMSPYELGRLQAHQAEGDRN